MRDIMTQIGLALVYYAALIVLVRLSGKRLAGQTTTFDLLVLISLGVVLQQHTVLPGHAQAVVFVATVFSAHRGLAAACARWPTLRRLVRGAPRTLVKDGRILEAALRDEGMTEADLRAGLRKLGFASPADVELAALEETGHVSAVGNRPSEGGPETSSERQP